MKRIGIDARLYSQTGVGTYLSNLITELQKIAPREIEFLIYVLPQDRSKVIITNNNFYIKEANFLWHTFGEQIGFYQQLNKDALDLMHFTYFGYPVFYQKPFVATVHDVTPLLYKTGKASTKNPFTYVIKHRVFQYILKNQILYAKKIFTPTKTVKNQLISLYGMQKDQKIIPTYEGINISLIQAKESIELKQKYSQPFYIYVGNFYPHKNIERLLSVFQSSKDFSKLILIGPDDYFAKRLLKSLDYNGRQKIQFYHHATLNDLKFFYTHAKALIHPSLSEGLGLPLIEAAYFHCPVIASNIPVFQEILGNSYIYFNPTDIQDIARTISNFEYSNDLIQPKVNFKLFSFPFMAKKTLEAYIKYL